MPKNVHLLTLEPWKQNAILVRFEHIFAKDEDPKYSQPVSFDFEDVFRGINVASLRETTLSANQWLNEANRLQFKAETVADESNVIPVSEEYSESNELEEENDDYTNFKITLNPMEIRTFVVKLKKE